MSPPKNIKIAIVGDVYFGSDSPELSLEIKTLLSQCDAVVANLESPICDSPHTSDSAVTQAAISEGFDKVFLRSKLGAERMLSDRGVQYVSLANNHIFDCGEEGFAMTCECLRKENIIFAGAGRNLSQAARSMVLEFPEMSVCLISAADKRSTSLQATPTTYGCNPLNESEIINQIQILKSQVDAVFVLPHWGDCGQIYPAPHIVRLGNAFLDAGAFLVAGHHSHTVQGGV